MNTRIATILAQEDLGVSGTKVIDINLKDIISRIMVVFRAQNGVDHNQAHPAANITKIEVVDGSDVLFSLSGKQAQGVNFYDRGMAPFSYIDTFDDHWNTAVFGLDFGRFLFDKLLAFDPNKFINPQLKITWNEVACNASADNNYCQVLADIFDELVPTPTGFFMTKEIYNYTVATTGYEYIDLPTDHPIQQIFIRCQLTEEVFGNMIDEIKLSEDNDKRIPLDITTANMLRYIAEQYGWVEDYIYAKGTTANQVLYMSPTDIGHGLGSDYGHQKAIAFWSNDGGTFYINTEGDNYNVKGVGRGLYPHGVVPLLPKPGNEIPDWYDVTKLGSLKLRIKDSATATTTPSAQVITKQYRTY